MRPNVPPHHCLWAEPGGLRVGQWHPVSIPTRLKVILIQSDASYIGRVVGVRAPTIFKL